MNMFESLKKLIPPKTKKSNRSRVCTSRCRSRNNVSEIKDNTPKQQQHFQDSMETYVPERHHHYSILLLLYDGATPPSSNQYSLPVDNEQGSIAACSLLFQSQPTHDPPTNSTLIINTKAPR
ncbi:hypothetical protein DFA_06575 [Cavenderia fasciculata]|uniref:Uncharacterized protein n=1 Tax=Cavenderia fasciculata TaxID=261658 RepID=F4PJD9_CACFS|nr:uncharacterized protein DFA_06575 [Cavenderia fasciculata]EGG24425.1 hypothetical protein DFA_06575 [Cavenderia fasciculata]|eukprot:XP_004362276.1 hypothetical protein DFA_06575 [Cavenderia fasciculata]